MNAATAIEVVDSKTGEVTIRPQGFTNEQTELIRRTLCPEATDDELSLFEARCIATGLDPFAGQIYLVKRGNTPATMQTGIDGFRLIAERTGERDGEDSPQWCGHDGVWRDVWLDSKPPAVCRVVVYRKGHTRGYCGLAYWSMYAQRKRDGELNSMWAKGGANMLAKCAEALALRKAFPNELSSLYTDDEMHQADVAPASPPATAATPPPIEPKLTDRVKELGHKIVDCRSEAEMDKVCQEGTADFDAGEREALKPIYRQHRETLRAYARLEKGSK